MQLTSMVGEFRLLHAALCERMRPEGERVARRWQFRAGDLHAALGQLVNGGGWQLYLPEGYERDPLSSADALAAVARDVQQLRERLERFERVAAAVQFEVIAQLPHFAAAHESLRALLQLRSADAGAPSLDQLEELPAPPARAENGSAEGG